MLDRAFWDEYMRLYDRGVGGLKPYRDLLDQLVNARALPAHARVLDAGCGTGNLILKLCEKNPDIEMMYGFERDPLATEMARTKCRDLRVQIHEADLNESEWIYGMDAVDAVYSCNVVYALQRPDVFLLNVSKILKPSGFFIATNAYQPFPERVFEAHDRWLTSSATEADRVRDDVVYAGPRVRIREMNQQIAAQAKDSALNFWGQEEWYEALVRARMRPINFLDDAYEGVNTFIVAQPL